MIWVRRNARGALRSWPPCRTRTATRARASSGEASERKIDLTLESHDRSVVSSAKLRPAAARRSILPEHHPRGANCRRAGIPLARADVNGR